EGTRKGGQYREEEAGAVTPTVLSPVVVVSASWAPLPWDSWGFLDARLPWSLLWPEMSLAYGSAFLPAGRRSVEPSLSRNSLVDRFAPGEFQDRATWYHLVHPDTTWWHNSFILNWLDENCS